MGLARLSMRFCEAAMAIVSSAGNEGRTRSSGASSASSDMLFDRKR